MRLALVALLALAGAPLEALEVPPLQARVNDLAEMIPPGVEQALEERLAAHETATGNQVAVLTVASLEGEVLEDYSLRVAEAWGLGREDVDDGVLFLVARDDRRMRLEVGYGLEPVLTDAESGRILDHVVKPRFRRGDLAEGFEAGVEAVLATLRGEAGAVETLAAPPPTESRRDLAFRFLGILIFLIVMIPFSLTALLGGGCSGWFLWLFLIPFWFAFPAGFVGPRAGVVTGAAWAVLTPLARLLLAGRWGKDFLERHPRLESVVTRVASSASGSGSSGFSGGSSFSGGGGSFGGGGASSSW